jgi:hypothetical protein
MLRTIPNDTHASLIHGFDETDNTTIDCDGEIVKEEKPFLVRFNGVLTIFSHAGNDLEVKRVLFPSTTKPAVLEMVTVKNISGGAINIKLGAVKYERITPAEKGVYGAYTIRADNGEGSSKMLKPGEELTTVIVYSALKKGESLTIDAVKEREKREEFIRLLNESLVLETPDPVIDHVDISLPALFMGHRMGDVELIDIVSQS